MKIRPLLFLRNLFVVLVCFSACYSCTKTITPKLDVASSQIVIQGVVSDTAGPYYVSIVNSVGFYANSIYPGISGAVITITDSSTGLKDQLTEVSQGVYRTSSLIQGVYGDTYLLN